MSKENVIVYTKEDCGACDTVITFLEQSGITVETRNTSKNQEYLQEVIDLGFKSVPVTIADGMAPFPDFDYPKLNQIVEQNQ